MSLTEGTYTWNIDDPTLLNKIINAKNCETFVSNVFEIAQLKWKIDIKPNGMSENNIGSFDVFLELMKLPSSWKDITICRNIESSQTKSSYIKISRYTNNASLGWPDYALTLKEITELKLKAIMIKISIKILEIRLKNNEIYYHIKFNYNKKQQLIWKFDPETMQKLKLSNTGKMSSSNIYNGMWAIRIAPNGWHHKYTGKCIVALGLCALPLNVNKMDVQWTISIKQLNFKKTERSEYSLVESSKCMISGAFEQFTSCDEFEIVVNILILREYDNDDKEINIASSTEWDEYVQQEQKQQFKSLNDNNIDDKLSLYDVKINSLSTNIEQQFKSLKNEFNIKIQQLLDTNKQNQQQIMQLLASQKLMTDNITQNQQQSKLMNDKLTQILEEEKGDDNGDNNILSEINKLKQEIEKLKSNNNNNNIASKRNEFQLFFDSDVCLPEYYDLFIQNGFDDLHSLQDITSDELKELGIVKMGHRKKILQCLKQRQSQINNIQQQNILQNEQYYEGNTAYI